MFGGGSSSLFGSAGANQFLLSVTKWTSIVFVITSLSLAALSSKKNTSLLDNYTPTQEEGAGAMPQTEGAKAPVEGNTAPVEKSQPPAEGAKPQTEGAKPQTEKSPPSDKKPYTFSGTHPGQAPRAQQVPHPTGKVSLSPFFPLFLDFAAHGLSSPPAPGQPLITNKGAGQALLYMDQVMERKRKQITQKCLKIKSPRDQGFMMLEVKVLDTGQTEARLLSTELKASGGFIQCSLEVLHRTRFKPLYIQKGFSRIYRFFIL